MSSLVERLRLHSSWRDSHGELNDAPNEAANEIERLREALRRIGLPEDTERTLMPLEMRMIAREALSLHKDDRDGD